MLIFFLHRKVCLPFSPYCHASGHKRRKSSLLTKKKSLAVSVVVKSTSEPIVLKLPGVGSVRLVIAV